MTRSQEIALRCAASLPTSLLLRGWMDERREEYMDAFRLTKTEAWHTLSDAFMDQLGACADDSARRLLLGVGERFEAPQAFAPVGMSRAVAERVRARAA